MDRGYFSKALYKHFYDTKVHALFRLKCDANRTVSRFAKSSKTILHTYIKVDDTMLPIRYFKYTIDNNKYILATTLIDSSVKFLQDMYIKRWGVETLFKRLKSYQNINTIYARSHKLWTQEMQLRILYDTLIIRQQHDEYTEECIEECQKTQKKTYNAHKFSCYIFLLGVQYSLVSMDKAHTSYPPD
jgi:hypothetical protein